MDKLKLVAELTGIYFFPLTGAGGKWKNRKVMTMLVGF